MIFFVTIDDDGDDTTCEGFPGGPVVEKLPTNARDTSSIPGSGKIPRSAGQQAHVPRPPQWEAHTLQLESSPHWSKPEKAHMQQQRRGAAQNK